MIVFSGPDSERRTTPSLTRTISLYVPGATSTVSPEAAPSMAFAIEAWSAGTRIVFSAEAPAAAKKIAVKAAKESRNRWDRRLIIDGKPLRQCVDIRRAIEDSRVVFRWTANVRLSGTIHLMSSPRKVPETTVRRLSLYYRVLQKVLDSGSQQVSSDQLAELARASSAQVRRDLASFGSFGVRGQG